MLELTTRRYGHTVRQFTETYGFGKSPVSEPFHSFIEAIRQKLKQLVERRRDKLKFCTLLIDGTPFEARSCQKRKAT